MKIASPSLVSPLEGRWLARRARRKGVDNRRGTGEHLSVTSLRTGDSSPQGEPWNGWFSVHSNICFIFRFLIVRPKIAAAIYGGPTASDGYLSIYSWQIGRHRRAHHQKTLLLRFLHGPWRAGPVTPVKQNRFLPSGSVAVNGADFAAHRKPHLPPSTPRNGVWGADTESPCFRQYPNGVLVTLSLQTK